MPPLPWSPGSPGEPLKPCTNNSYKHNDCRDINMLPILLTCALLAYVWSYLPGLSIYAKDDSCSGKAHCLHWKRLLGSRLHEPHNPNLSLLLPPRISDEASSKRCTALGRSLTFPGLTVRPQGCAHFHRRHSVLI